MFDREGDVLGDITILAIEQYGAGPFGSVYLADLGAQVIKIEDPSTGGDVGRYVPPFASEGTSLFFETFNRNKRSLRLDLTNAAGREVFESLVARSDAVYSNLRGDVPEKLRIRYKDLEHINPLIVCCSLSGFGMDGPRRSEPGYDNLMQAMAGWMSVTGEPEGPPTKSGLSVVDYAGGLVAAVALLAGIHAARRDGQGSDCDLALFDVAINFLTYLASWHLFGGFEPTKTQYSAHPSLVPFQNFPTADGWIVVTCPKEKFWQLLVHAIGRPELGADPRFKDFDSRRSSAHELLPILEETFIARPTADWVERLTNAGVPCAPVREVSEALRDPQVVARRLIATIEHQVLGTVHEVMSPIRFSGYEGPLDPSPMLGADQSWVLGGILGMVDAEIAALAERGAFGGIPGEPVEVSGD